jgi:hypothetical protein
MRSDRGASRQLLQGALDLEIQVLISVPLIIEYEAVLTRPERLDSIGLGAEQVNEILDALAVVAIAVHLSIHGARD